MKYLMIVLLTLAFWHYPALYGTEAMPENAEKNRIEKLIKNLEHEDYKVRSEATYKLQKLPAEYSEKFIRRSFNEIDLEVKTRLFTIAKHIYYIRGVLKEDTYLKTKGCLGLDLNKLWIDSELVAGIVNSDPGEPSEGKLKQYDLIIKVNGEEVTSEHIYKLDDNKYGLKPNEEITFTVKRFSEKDLEGINGAYDLAFLEKILTSGVEHDILEIKVTSGWMFETYMSRKEEKSLLRDLWEGFRSNIEGDLRNEELEKLGERENEDKDR